MASKGETYALVPSCWFQVGRGSLVAFSLRRLGVLTVDERHVLLLFRRCCLMLSQGAAKSSAGSQQQRTSPGTPAHSVWTKRGEKERQRQAVHPGLVASVLVSRCCLVGHVAVSWVVALTQRRYEFIVCYSVLTNHCVLPTDNHARSLRGAL